MTGLIALSRWHRPLVVLCGCLSVLSVVCLGGLVFDHRILAGAPIWMKPLKFCVSIVIFGGTMAWLLPKLHRTPRLARYVGNVMAAAGFIEMPLIVTQVIRGRQSHFNVSTPLDATIFGIMGTTITVLWSAGIVAAAALIFQRPAGRVLTSALRSGLVISVAGMAVGFLMTGPTAAQLAAMKNGTFNGIMGAHSVGVRDGGPGLPLVGWSTVGGDLRVPHFFGLHGLQAIPLIALLLAVAARHWAVLRDEEVRLRLVRVAAAGYGGILLLLIWQAERAQSLIHPDRLTLTALGLLLGVVVVAAGLVTIRRPVPVPEVAGDAPAGLSGEPEVSGDAPLGV
jgi:hypothetical protein